MLKLMRDFIMEEDGLGTVEIVIIIAVLVGIALIFRGVIIGFVKDILSNIWESEANTEIDSGSHIEDITGRSAP
ncbi:UNVERIFIED_CONTAM: putative flagellin with Flp1-like domain [Acetivibrio alkalicellulosi]